MARRESPADVAAALDRVPEAGGRFAALAPERQAGGLGWVQPGPGGRAGGGGLDQVGRRAAAGGGGRRAGGPAAGALLVAVAAPVAAPRRGRASDLVAPFAR